MAHRDDDRAATVLVRVIAQEGRDRGVITTDSTTVA